jgi:tetratricopeptide (TPR) repeat protein
VGYSGTKTLPELNSLMSSCISKSPSEERYLALATSFSMGLKEYSEAIKYSDLLLKQNSRSSDALRLSAYSFEALQDFNGAITRRKMLELVDPFELENLRNISLDFIALSDKPKALVYRDKIKNIDPNNGFVVEIDAKLAKLKE